MSNFDLLHPALQHHIVNSLGWRTLRPFQDDVIPPILSGKNMVILAPTAGGKTEAAFLPILSRMMTEGWQGLSVLYICPIKALLNNIEERLDRYATLVGRKAALWHGDVAHGGKNRIEKDRPDCLLTTPESLEGILISSKRDARNFFHDVRAVIVDEIHAFAGDDRGWHMLCVLERISRISGREIQRIGLSATVGNPEGLMNWLTGSCRADRGLYVPATNSTSNADIKVDYVGNLANAATIIARLHRGAKRLVFVDSRSKTEQLAGMLKELGVETFVNHSSLSLEERRLAEDAFSQRKNCVIVATSTLELGLDIGDLDHVIQIDSPSSVSAFLQRMGRTGRRPGSQRNCLFLATYNDALLSTLAVIELWMQGYVEPVEAPPVPYHLLAQQLLAIILQEKGTAKDQWFDWICQIPIFRDMPHAERMQIEEWMLGQDILWLNDGIYWFGKQGEKKYGKKNFLDLVSVFTSPPLVTIFHGRQELGSVDDLTFLGRTDEPRIVSLGGRSWKVNHIDWDKRIAFVEATDMKGHSRWRGEGRGLSYRICQTLKNILKNEDEIHYCSQRARTRLNDLRSMYGWIDGRGTYIARDDERNISWWTFGGTKANYTIAGVLSQMYPGVTIRSDAFKITMAGDDLGNEIHPMIANLRDAWRNYCSPFSHNESALKCMKYADLLPPGMPEIMMHRRMSDWAAFQDVIGSQIVFGSSIPRET